MRRCLGRSGQDVRPHRCNNVVARLVPLVMMFAGRFCENGSKQGRSLNSRGVEAWQAHMLAGVINGESSGELPWRTSQRHNHHTANLQGRRRSK